MLSLSSASKLSDEGIKAIVTLTELRELRLGDAPENIDNCSLTVKATTFLAELVHLRCLWLRGGDLTDDAAIPLKELYHLRELDLSIGSSSILSLQQTHRQGGSLHW